MLLDQVLEILADSRNQIINGITQAINGLHYSLDGTRMCHDNCGGAKHQPLRDRDGNGYTVTIIANLGLAAQAAIMGTIWNTSRIMKSAGQIPTTFYFFRIHNNFNCCHLNHSPFIYTMAYYHLFTYIVYN